jgi:hypothetical protein
MILLVCTTRFCSLLLHILQKTGRGGFAPLSRVVNARLFLVILAFPGTTAYTPVQFADKKLHDIRKQHSRLSLTSQYRQQWPIAALQQLW